MRRTVATTCLALVGGLLVPLAVGLPGAEAVAPVVSRTGTLTVHAAGYPVAGTPAWRQLVSATVAVDVVNARVRAQITLADVPQTDTDRVDLWLGRYRVLDDGTRDCSGGTQFAIDAVAPSDGATRAGTVITLDRASSDAASQPWDCAFVVSQSMDREVPLYDVLIGPLAATLGPEPTPQLSVTGISILRKSVGTLKLVRGVWTTLHVTVANADGAADAEGLVVTGSGKGLKVRSSAPETSPTSEGTTRTVDVMVKVTGRKKPKALTLVARSGATAVARSVTVRTAAAPAAPRSGTYTTKGSSVRFSIKNGRVVNFLTGNIPTRCGGFPDPFSYSSAPYSHPKVKIPRNGLVDDLDRGNGFVTQLQLKVVGAKVTQGYFAYYGPARCFAQVSFTAKRGR